MRYFLVAVVFVLNAYTLARLFGSPVSRRNRLAWAAAIVLLPLVGAAAWIIRDAGHRRSPQGES